MKIMTHLDTANYFCLFCKTDLLIINSILQVTMAIFSAVESWNWLPVICQFYSKENIIEVQK